MGVSVGCTPFHTKADFLLHFLAPRQSDAMKQSLLSPEDEGNGYSSSFRQALESQTQRYVSSRPSSGSPKEAGITTGRSYNMDSTEPIPQEDSLTSNSEGRVAAGIALTCSLRLVALTAALGSFASGYACASIGGAILFMEKDQSGFWPADDSNHSTSSPSPSSLAYPSRQILTTQSHSLYSEDYLEVNFDSSDAYLNRGSSSMPQMIRSETKSQTNLTNSFCSSHAHKYKNQEKYAPSWSEHFFHKEGLQDSTPTYFTNFRRGLLVSCILASGMIGALFASSFANLVGRRTAQLLNNAFFVGGSLAMAFAPSYWWLVYARTAVGIGVGVSSALTNLYISEISPAPYRGELGGWAPFSVTAGILTSYLLAFLLGDTVEAPLAWRVILGCGAFPAGIMLLIGAFEKCLPESPRWLLTKGRPVRAFRSSILLHGREQSAQIQRELDGILIKMTSSKAAVHDRSSHLEPTSDLSTRDVTGDTRSARTPSERLESELVAGLGDDVSGCDCCCRLCSRRKYRGAMLAGIGINVLQQVSGINVVIYFGPQILNEAGFSNVEATALTAGVSIAQLISVAVLMRLVDRVGRRPMAFLGLVFMIVGLGTIGTAFLLLCKHAGDSSGSSSQSLLGAWAAVVGMLIYRIAFSLSLGPLPYIVTAEVFPSEVRSCGVTVSWAANWVTNFGVTLSFPLVKEAFAELTGGSTQLGSSCLFGVYVIFSALAVFFVAKYVPETARRELEEL